MEIDRKVQSDECRVQNQDWVVLCLVRDLLFYSKIRSAAEAAGVPLKSLRDPAKLTGESGVGLIVDLNQPDALNAAIVWRSRSNRPVIGFVSHVDVDTINQARTAGIDRILARSQFEQNISAILSELKSQSQSAI